MPDGQQWNPVPEVRAKYPGLKDWSDDSILKNLSDPAKFRTEFPQYAHVADDVIKKNINGIRVAPFLPKQDNKEGLYQMETDDGTAYGIPYSQVIPAGKFGLKLKPDARSTFITDYTYAQNQADKEHPRVGPHADLKFKPATTPQPTDAELEAMANIIPDSTKGPARGATAEFWDDIRKEVQERAAPKDKEKWKNFARRVGAGLFGMVDFPVTASGAVIDSMSSDPKIAMQGINQLNQLLPPEQVISRIQEFKSDWKKDPNTALNNAAADSLTLMLAHRAGKGAEKLTDLSATGTKEGLRSGIRDTLGVPEHTEKTVEKYGKEAEANREQNATIAGKNRETKIGSLKNRKAEEAAHQQKMEVARKHNDGVLRDRAKREETQEKLESATRELEEKYEKAEKSAKKEDDNAWDAWREKVAGQEVPTEGIVATIKAQNSVMDPEDVAEFNKILDETKPGGGDAAEVSSTKDSVAIGQGAGSYEEASPKVKAAIDDIVSRLGLDPNTVETLEAVGAERLHVWKTQLEYAVRKATRGNVRYAIGKVLDSVRDTETEMSQKAGAGKELETARKLHGPFMDTFRNSPNAPSTVASKSLAEISPEQAKEQARAERLQMVGAYDHSIPQLAEHIANMREGLKALPKDQPLREQIKDYPPPLEPAEKPDLKPPEPPPDVPNIQAENLKLIHNQLRRFGKLGTWVARLLVGGAAGVLAHQDLSHFSADLLIGQMGVTLLTHALRAPSVLEWLARPSEDDIKAINTLPPQDAAKMREAIGTLAGYERKNNPHLARVMKMAPAMAVFLAGGSVGKQATDKKSLDEIKKEAEKRKPDAAPGPQSSAVKPSWTHVFDESTGTIRAA